MKRINSLKNSLALVMLCILMLTTTSCEKFLDQKPDDGLVRSEFWKNKEEVLQVLSGAYAQFADNDAHLFINGELRGDLVNAVVLSGSNNNNVDQIAESSIQLNNFYAKWDRYYAVINLCNHVIKLAPGVQAKDKTFDGFTLNQYVAEAVFLRSLTYFYLVRIFHSVPYITEPSETDNTDFFKAKEVPDSVLSYIKQDLEAIRSKIPSEYADVETSKCRATAGAVNALLADISLWNFEYEDCIKYVDAVEESNKYFLLPATTWFENYYPGFSLENIFELYYNSSLSQNNRTQGLTTSGNLRYIPSTYAFEILNKDFYGAAEPIRATGSIGERSGQIWKYYGSSIDGTTSRSGSNSSSANFIVYRLADLYLMKAEALSQLGRYDDALTYINYIRERANVSLLSLNEFTRSYEDLILLERAKELAFEGKRWFDLLRMGRRNNYQNKTKLINILVQNVPSSQRLVKMAKLSNPLGWYLPIHEDEIDRNYNLTQNPYYDDED